MGSEMTKSNAVRRFVTTAALATVAVACAATGRAQSTDMNKPTPMTSNELKGVGEASERQYYYSFTAGPGEMIVVLDTKVGAPWEGVEVELFDKSFKPLGRVFGVNDQKIGHVELKRAQPVIMQLTVGKGVETYRIRLTGPVEFGAAASAPAPARTNGTSAARPAAAGLGCIPKSGILRIELEDGTSQEVNLARVKQVSVR